MKRVPSLPKLNTSFSIKDFIITKAYFSTTMDAVADELSFDTPYNLVSSIQDSGNIFSNIMSNNQVCYESSQYDLTKEHIHHFVKTGFLTENVNSLIIWSSIAIFCTAVHFYRKNKPINMERLEHFISYSEIKKQIRNVLLILFFTLVRNVQSAS